MSQPHHGRRHAVAATVLCPLLAASGLQAQDDAELVARARAIHERVLTIDTHDDIPFDFASPEVNPCQRLDRQVDIPKMREGGLDVGFFIVYVGQTERTPENYERAQEQAMQKFDAIHRMARELCPDQIEIAHSADDVERIHRSGKLVAAIGIENGYVIGKDLALLRKYHTLGARYMTLAHGGHNDIADSSTPRFNLGDGGEEHGGLSAFGEQVVAEMNRLGIFVDVSHISRKAALHAARVSKAPVIASHSSTVRWADVPRNMDDEQLRAVAATGGVVQMVALGGYVKVPPQDRQQALQTLREEFDVPGGRGGQRALAQLSAERRAEYERRLADLENRYPFDPPAVKDFVNHIDHAVSVIGIDHVGISSDFDGGGGIEGWNDASETFNVTLELVRRGYTEEQIAKIWGGNLLRAWRRMEEVARELQARNAN
jgi:membrane dipeptidase